MLLSNHVGRKILALGLVVLLFLSFSSCKREEIPPQPSSSEPSPTESETTPPSQNQSPAPSETEQPSPSPAESTDKVTEQVYEKDYVLEGVNHEIKGELYLSLPSIQSEENPEYAEMINEYFASQLEKYREGFEVELTELVDQDITGIAATSRYLDVSYQTTYNRNGILSFFITIRSYQGGAHDILAIRSETFNLATEVRITADDLFAVDESVYTGRIKAYILKEMDEKAKQEESPYYENYEELLEMTYQKESFVLTESGLRVYFQIYDLAPYAAGSFHFEIPYAELSDLLNQDIRNLLILSDAR